MSSGVNEINTTVGIIPVAELVRMVKMLIVLGTVLGVVLSLLFQVLGKFNGVCVKGNQLNKNAQRNIKKVKNKDKYGQFEGQGRTLCRKKTNST